MSKAFLCKSCNQAVTIPEFINSCDESWLPQQWFSYNCPRCKSSHTLEIKSEVVRFGIIAGGPGPCFIPEFTQRIPGLKFQLNNDSIKLSFENYSKEIKIRN
jgi:hypothetical protein